MKEEISGTSVETRDGVMWITLSRPHAMNALSPAMLSDISRAMVEAEASEAVKCVVFIGEGKAFCAGADLSTVPAGSEGISALLKQAAATMNEVASLAKPVIACLNGITLAGGLELALCADIIVAARSAEIGDGHIRYGLIPGGGGSVRLARAIGSSRARYLLFTGARMAAADLERWGLVQQVFDDADLRNCTSVLAATIASHSPLALRALKRLVSHSHDNDLESLLAEEFAANTAHARSQDMREGLTAFAEKRKPIFVGR